MDVTASSDSGASLGLPEGTKQASRPKRNPAKIEVLWRGMAVPVLAQDGDTVTIQTPCEWLLKVPLSEVSPLDSRKRRTPAPDHWS